MINTKCERFLVLKVLKIIGMYQYCDYIEQVEINLINKAFYKKADHQLLDKVD